MNGIASIRTVAKSTLFAVCVSALSLPAWATVLSQSTPAAEAAVTKMTRTGPEVLPPALRPVVYQTLAAEAGAPYDLNSNGCARLPGQRVTACFDKAGAHFSGPGSRLALHLVAWGRNHTLVPVVPVQPTIKENRVRYTHPNVNEWWRMLPVGFEQGFTIAKRPAGRGKLIVALAAKSRATHKDSALRWGKLRYGQLVVMDADGNIVPARLESDGNRILIAVNDARAAYPLTIDPMVWLEREIVANEGATYDWFGWSVAVEGNTALVGAPTCYCNGSTGEGAAYVFQRDNGVWTETQRLAAGDPAEGARFGWSVALDGTTAMIGATSAGAVYVFTESQGTWAQTQKLVPGDPESAFFFGTAIDLQGNTAIIGSPFANAAYVFAATDGTWSQTQKLTADDAGSGDLFGISVSLEGQTALIGAFGATVNGNSGQGAAYVFTTSNGTWTQSQKLQSNDGAAGDEFGQSVALDGDTALIGAPQADTQGPFTNQGAVYVFHASDGSWTQSQKLTVDVPPGGGGFGQAIAAEGDTTIVSADNAVQVGNTFEGAAYVFANSGGTWSQTQELVASDGTVNDFFGWGYNSVAFQDGIALIGAYNATINGDQEQGKAYFYGESNLGLNMSAPQTVGQGQTYVSQTIATNNASAASPAVSATITVPAAASFVSASATQGSCSEASGVVTCDFGTIDGNAGTATANVTLKATGNDGDTIDNTASIAKATPALSASAPTQITGSQSCPDGYTSYAGTLAPGERASSPGYAAPKGIENGILISPPGFRLFMLVKVPGHEPQLIGSDSSNEIHHQAPAGNYKWIAQAWAGSGGGAYTLCVMHP